jgi:alkyl hydroperoxide reductase subunit AhpF
MSHPHAEPTAPSDNPEGEEGIMAQSQRFDMLVLGSGAAGKRLAWHMAQVGSRTAVVERQLIGGSCPNINCLPSKNEIWSAKLERELLCSPTRKGSPAPSGLSKP